MKTQVSHENRIHRLVEFAMIATVMSIFIARTREFPVSQTAIQTKTGGWFTATPAVTAMPETQNGEKTTAPLADAPVASPIYNGTSSERMPQAATTFSVAKLLEFATPETEKALLLEDWMTNAEVWKSPEGEEVATEVTAEMGTGAVSRNEITLTASPAIGSPEWVAEMSVIEFEPPLVWTTREPAFDAWIASEIQRGAIAIPMESFEPADLTGDFDCQAFLKSQIRLNEAMVEAEEAPLRLESWMLDESLFLPELKAENPSVENGASENGKKVNQNN